MLCLVSLARARIWRSLSWFVLYKAFSISLFLCQFRLIVPFKRCWCKHTSALCCRGCETSRASECDTSASRWHAFHRIVIIKQAGVLIFAIALTFVHVTEKLNVQLGFEQHATVCLIKLNLGTFEKGERLLQNRNSSCSKRVFRCRIHFWHLENDCRHPSYLNSTFENFSR